MKRVCQLLVWAIVVGLLDSTPLGRENKSTCSVKYFLYTQLNPTLSQELHTGDLQSVTESNFYVNNPTKILIHGWTKSSGETPNPQVRSAYLDTGEYNVISVDWAECAALNYVAARYKVSEVGANVATFIDFLNQYAGMSFESLVVIGHSLGAHIAGFSGKYVTRGRLPYIVGLDPAYPLFVYDDVDERLYSGDADYVETIQTNGGVKGTLQPVGSASYYPNWGRTQPGCGLDLNGNCAHLRSVLYYAEAIRWYKYTPIYLCPSYANIQDKEGCNNVVPSLDIGDPTMILRENGIFYLTTASQAPFGHT